MGVDRGKRLRQGHPMSNTYAKATSTGLYFNGRAFEAKTAAEALALRPGTKAEDFRHSWSCEVEIEVVDAPVTECEDCDGLGAFSRDFSRSVRRSDPDSHCCSRCHGTGKLAVVPAPNEVVTTTTVRLICNNGGAAAPVEKFTKVSDSRTGRKSGTERHYQSGNLHLYVSTFRHKPTDRFKKARIITEWRAIRWDEASRKVTAELKGEGGFKDAIKAIAGKI